MSPERVKDDLAGSIRAQQSLDRSAKTDGESGKAKTGMTAFAEITQRLAKAAATSFTPSIARQLESLARSVLRDAERQAYRLDPNNTYVHDQMVETARSQMRQLAAAMNPPGEILESADFQKLLETLHPAAKKLHEEGYTNEALIRGSVRGDMMNRQVQEAVTEADKSATERRVDSARRSNLDVAAIANATRTLMGMARLIKRRTKKKKVSDSDEVSETTETVDSGEVTREEAEELCGKALDVMRVLREEFAPRWAPAQQPWFVNAADQEVYSILLSVVPEELFKQTQAFEDMQELRSGDQVFTLRAADKLGEAVKRK
ncbi:MAG: hypothetical protein HY903_23245 [Deltaproteobacteria bacterium]|nr:hypothetical protein [Deltaproteobacteria bacterium]